MTSSRVEKYISGLSSFILECDTPMTIAIQGNKAVYLVGVQTAGQSSKQNRHNRGAVPNWRSTHSSISRRSGAHLVGRHSCGIEDVPVGVVFPPIAKLSLLIDKGNRSQFATSGHTLPRETASDAGPDTSEIRCYKSYRNSLSD